MKFNNRAKKYYPLLLLIVVTVFLGTTLRSPNDIYDKINRNMDIFGRVYKEVALNYVDDIDPDKFMKAGIEGMLSTLDPYTVYYDESSKDQLDLISTGKYGGIGVSIGIKDSAVFITEIMPGYEAERKGLRIGDRITSIDGNDIKDAGTSQFRTYFRGAPGSTVTVGILREGQSFTVSLVREEINLKVISYSGMLEPSDAGIGYIKLDRFTLNSDREFDNALRSLKAKGNLKGLVIDLRNNGGGLLDAAIGILNKLVDKNSLLLITKGKDPNSEKKYFSTEEPVIDRSVPIAVLVNENTASASEIVAGAIQDLDRGIIVGTKSFGKGLVQEIRDLSFDTKMKITASKYFTPSGRWIQQKNYFKENKSGVFMNKDKYDQTDFKTLGGRMVYANGGITPDIEVKTEAESDLHFALLSKDMFFRFSNYYVETHPGITKAEISDGLFAEFKRFLSDNNFEYNSTADKKIDELQKIASDKNYSSSVKDLVTRLRNDVDNEKMKEIDENKDELLMGILSELNKRLVKTSDQVASSLTYDKQVLEAAKTLKDRTEYNRILSKLN